MRHKYIIFTLLITIFLLTTSCTKEKTTIANPASVYCNEQGGNLTIIQTQNGSYAECTLQDGITCEEWAYFRGECPKIDFNITNQDKRYLANSLDECNKINIKCNEDEIAFINANGCGCEIRKTRIYTREESEQIAREYITNSSIYKDNAKNLILTKTDVLRCPYCWLYTFTFNKDNSGYIAKITAIEGNIATGTINMIDDEAINYCTNNSDCIPDPSKCHPKDCINNAYKDQFLKAEVCTTLFDTEAAYQKEDCLCINNQCTNNNSIKNITEDKKTYCTKEQRNVDACYTLYEPVCGWFNQSINCIKYPCASDYPNDCSACKDSKVEFITKGKCPK